MEDCLFCKIASGEIEANVVYENDKVFCFEDIHPVAPVHVLIVPREHIKSINELTEENADIMKDIALAIKEVAIIKGISNDGYRAITNIGQNGGQLIKHLHFHVIGGKPLGPKIVNS